MMAGTFGSNADIWQQNNWKRAFGAKQKTSFNFDYILDIAIYFHLIWAWAETFGANADI
jgi:hypothetical protein